MALDKNLVNFGKEEDTTTTTTTIKNTMVKDSALTETGSTCGSLEDISDMSISDQPTTGVKFGTGGSAHLQLPKFAASGSGTRQTVSTTTASEEVTPPVRSSFPGSSSLTEIAPTPSNVAAGTVLGEIREGRGSTEMITMGMKIRQRYFGRLFLWEIVRFWATVYFCIVAVAWSGIANTSICGVILEQQLKIAYFKLKQRFLKRNSSSPLFLKTIEDLKIDEDVRKGQWMDLGVRQIMRSCGWIWKRQIVGRPCLFERSADPNFVQNLPRYKWDSFSSNQDLFLSASSESSTTSSSSSSIEYCLLPMDEATGKVTLAPGTIIMSNHLSNIDGFALKAALYPVCPRAIMKAEIVRIPCIGWTIWLAKEPLVHFTKAKGGWGVAKKESTMARSEEIVKRGLSLMIYPEGTRQMFGRMAPFRLGMFNFAIQNRCPIYATVIHGSEKAWPVHSARVDRGTIYLKFSRKLFLPKPGDSAEELAKAVQAEMLDLLKEVPGYIYEDERPFDSLESYRHQEEESKRVAASATAKRNGAETLSELRGKISDFLRYHHDN